jgi:hypothetical protein
MMKPYPALLVAALILSACATAAPQPAQEPRPTTIVVQPPPDAPPPAAPQATISVVPERWWLLDAETDGVYGASVDRAYREVLAAREPRRTIVVAVIDSGVDVEHEDLRDNLWRNPRETKNGQDDDGDGLVDDIYGWNFIGGRDGSHVDVDTYEVARLYAACERLLGNAAAAGAPPRREGVDAGDCPRIAEDFHDKRRENEEMLEQLRQMDFAVDAITSLLRRELGTDTLSVEAVRSLTPLRNDVRQAQAAYLELTSHDITPKMIKDELERVERVLERAD